MEATATRRHEMAILDRSGDTKTTWDPDNPDEVENARTQFKYWKDKGYAIFRVKKGGDKGEVMTKFDPEADKMIIVPPIAGG